MAVSFGKQTDPFEANIRRARAKVASQKAAAAQQAQRKITPYKAQLSVQERDNIEARFARAQTGTTSLPKSNTTKGGSRAGGRKVGGTKLGGGGGGFSGGLHPRDSKGRFRNK